MTECAAITESMLAEPYTDLHRLALADWLTEHGREAEAEAWLAFKTCADIGERRAAGAAFRAAGRLRRSASGLLAVGVAVWLSRHLKPAAPARRRVLAAAYAEDSPDPVGWWQPSRAYAAAQLFAGGRGLASGQPPAAARTAAFAYADLVAWVVTSHYEAEVGVTTAIMDARYGDAPPADGGRTESALYRGVCDWLDGWDVLCQRAAQAAQAARAGRPRR